MRRFTEVTVMPNLANQKHLSEHIRLCNVAASLFSTRSKAVNVRGNLGGGFTRRRSWAFYTCFLEGFPFNQFPSCTGNFFQLNNAV